MRAIDYLVPGTTGGSCGAEELVLVRTLKRIESWYYYLQFGMLQRALTTIWLMVGMVQ
jgi:hypothetical protein